jgi:hypothetical protein
MPRGSAIPKGRISLPREPKAKPKDKVLVFAEGKTAEEARRAGADIVGGAELVEGVRGRYSYDAFEADFALSYSRWQAAESKRHCFYQRLLSSRPFLSVLVVSLARVASCLPNAEGPSQMTLRDTFAACREPRSGKAIKMELSELRSRR